MGFECGFNSAKRFKDISIEGLLSVDSYLKWEGDEWCKDHFITFESYFGESYSVYPELPAEEVVNFYRGMDSDIIETIEFWCSSGRLLDNFITENSERIEENLYLISNEFIDRAYEWVNKKLYDNRLVPVQILRAYKYKNDKCKSLSNCDGVEVMDEEGNRKFVDGSNDIIYVASSGFNTDENYTYEKFKDVLERLKKDLEEGNLVWYYRSY